MISGSSKAPIRKMIEVNFIAMIQLINLNQKNQITNRKKNHHIILLKLIANLIETSLGTTTHNK